MADSPSLQPHIEHYRQLLEVEFDPERREIVARLLKEAEVELSKAGKVTDAGASSDDEETRRRRAREDQDRLAENPTAAAETFSNRQRRAEMSDEEKLQRRIDDQMAHTP